MKTIFSILLIFAAATVLAQPKYLYLGINYDMPLSNKDWVSKGSAQGIRLGYRSFITDRVSAGIDLGSSSVNEYKPTRTIESSTGAITTDYFNYIYSYSAVISGQYNFLVGDGDLVFPHVGLGLGANYNEYTQYYNIYTDSDKAFGFLARPEAGILVRFGTRRSLGAMASVHYDYSTNKSEVFGYKNYSTVGFQIGLMFMDL
ncbi:MAG TPA: outer membrane beta-barrel protein [Chryseosolibacter sp.]